MNDHDRIMRRIRDGNIDGDKFTSIVEDINECFDGDPEVAHILVDELLLMTIVSLAARNRMVGFDGGIKAIEKMDLWYA